MRSGARLVDTRYESGAPPGHPDAEQDREMTAMDQETTLKPDVIPPSDNAFRRAARTVIVFNKKALEILRDK